MSMFGHTLKCVSCLNLLNEPVFLPCGHSICREHQQTKSHHHNHQTSKQTIACKACNVTHDIPETGFVRNIACEQLLQRNIEHMPVCDEYRETLDAVSQLGHVIGAARITLSAQSDEIGRVVATLKNGIEARLKLINERAMQLMNELEVYETECGCARKSDALQRAGVELDTMLRAATESCKEWENELLLFKKTNKFSKSRWEEIQRLADSIADDLNHALDKFRDELFCKKLGFFTSKIKSFFIDSLSDNKIELTVNNVKSLTTIEGIKEFNSKLCEAFGFTWYTHVIITDGPDEKKTVSLFLHVDTNRLNYELNVDYHLGILSIQKNPNTSYGKKFNCLFKENCDKNGFQIPLEELMANPEIYDAKEDCFTTRAIISKIKWIK